MNMLLSGKTSNVTTEKDLDIIKNKAIKQDNLKKKAMTFGLQHLLVKSKYFKGPIPKNNPTD